jgi:hypothetical protein
VLKTRLLARISTFPAAQVTGLNDAHSPKESVYTGQTTVNHTRPFHAIFPI